MDLEATVCPSGLQTQGGQEPSALAVPATDERICLARETDLTCPFRLSSHGLKITCASTETSQLEGAWQSR